jgi:hypothetical protein
VHQNPVYSTPIKAENDWLEWGILRCTNLAVKAKTVAAGIAAPNLVKTARI